MDLGRRGLHDDGGVAVTIELPALRGARAVGVRGWWPELVRCVDWDVEARGRMGREVWQFVFLQRHVEAREFGEVIWRS